jgi:hypothetical protein
VTAVSGRAARRGPGLLRIAALRWLAAELIPFGCLVGGLALAREVRPAAAAGYILALFAGTPLTIFYLYKVLGSAAAWVWAIAPLMIGSTVIGGILFGNSEVHTSQHPSGTRVVVTGTWWIVVAALAVVLALAVAGAIANGERWIARHAGNLPRTKFEKYARSRGTLARLWLTR